MDSLALFKVRHAELRPAFERAIIAGLPDEQWRARPHQATNPIAWPVWHVARSEDFAANRQVAGRPQVLDEGGWRARLGVPPGRVGTGMTDAEVGDFGARVDPAALVAYSEAVGARTTAILDELRPEHLERPLTADEVRQQLTDTDALGGVAEDAPLFQGTTWPHSSAAPRKSRSRIFARCAAARSHTCDDRAIRPHTVAQHRFGTIPARGRSADSLRLR